VAFDPKPNRKPRPGPQPAAVAASPAPTSSPTSSPIEPTPAGLPLYVRGDVGSRLDARGRDAPRPDDAAAARDRPARTTTEGAPSSSSPPPAGVAPTAPKGRRAPAPAPVPPAPVPPAPQPAAKHAPPHAAAPRAEEPDELALAEAAPAPAEEAEAAIAAAVGTSETIPDDGADPGDATTDPQLVRARLDGMIGDLRRAGSSARDDVEHARDDGVATLESREADASDRVRADVRRGTRELGKLFDAERKTWSGWFKGADVGLAVGGFLREAFVVVRGIGAIGGIKRSVDKARDDFETAIQDSIKRVDTIKTKQQDELHRRNQGAADDARKLGDVRMARVTDDDLDLRIDKREAIRDLTDPYAEGLEKQEPEGKKAIADGLADLPPQIREEGDKNKAQLQDPTPQIAPPIAQATVTTARAVADQTTSSRAQLAELGRAALGALVSGERDARRGLARVGAAAQGELRRALRRSRKSLKRAADRMIDELGGSIDAAVGQVDGAKAPDLRRARRFAGWVASRVERGAQQFVDAMPSMVDGLSRGFLDIAAQAGHRVRTMLDEAGALLVDQRADMRQRLDDAVKGVGDALDAIQKVFFDQLDDTQKQTDDKLSGALRDMKAKFAASLDDADSQLGAKIKETYDKVDAKLPELNDKINDALSDVEWHHDHPYLAALEDAVEWTAGFIVSVVKWVANLIKWVIIGLIAALILMVVLGISFAAALLIVAVAAVILLVGSIAYATYKRVQEAKEKGIDRSFVASLGLGFADATGFTTMYRSFTIKGLTPFQRGEMFGEGLGDLANAVLVVVGLTGAIKGFRLNKPIATLDPSKVDVADFKGLDKIDLALRMKKLGRIERLKAIGEGLRDLGAKARSNPRAMLGELFDSLRGKRNRVDEIKDYVKQREAQRLADEQAARAEAARRAEAERTAREERERLEREERERLEREERERLEREERERLAREEAERLAREAAEAARQQRAEQQREEMFKALDQYEHGRDMFRDVRQRLANADAMTPQEKADAFDALQKEINKRDSSWQAPRRPATVNGKKVPGFFQGEGRPFGFLIDEQGNVWQAMDVKPSIGGYESDFSLKIDLDAVDAKGNRVWTKMEARGPGEGGGGTSGGGGGGGPTPPRVDPTAPKPAPEPPAPEPAKPDAPPPGDKAPAPIDPAEAAKQARVKEQLAKVLGDHGLADEPIFKDMDPQTAGKVNTALQGDPLARAGAEVQRAALKWALEGAEKNPREFANRYEYARAKYSEAKRAAAARKAPNAAKAAADEVTPEKLTKALEKDLASVRKLGPGEDLVDLPPDATPEEIARRVQALDRLRYESETAEAYHAIKHQTELPPPEAFPRTGDPVADFAAAAKDTIKTGTAEATPLEGGKTRIRIVKTYGTGADATVLEAIIYVDAAGRVTLATFGKAKAK
jgi:hypothetical protein